MKHTHVLIAGAGPAGTGAAATLARAGVAIPNFPRLFKPIFKRFFDGTGTLSRGYLDVMDGTRGYTDLWALLWHRILGK